MVNRQKIELHIPKGLSHSSLPLSILVMQVTPFAFFVVVTDHWSCSTSISIQLPYLYIISYSVDCQVVISLAILLPSNLYDTRTVLYCLEMRRRFNQCGTQFIYLHPWEEVKPHTTPRATRKSFQYHDD